MGVNELFFSAVFNNSTEVAEFLLTHHGADINEKYINDNTVLHSAAFSNNKETIPFLLLHGSNVNEKITEDQRLFILHHIIETHNYSSSFYRDFLKEFDFNHMIY